MKENINLNKYSDFVEGVTSVPSRDLESLINRMLELEKVGANVPALLTAGFGLPGEAGEFSELVKKIMFHGKDYSEENIALMKKELGDVAWYWVKGCRALGIDPNKVISDNVKKLESRYPGGVFNVWNSENRKEDNL